WGAGSADPPRMKARLATSEVELATGGGGSVAIRPSSPTRQAFLRFRRHRPAVVGAGVLVAIALSVLVGPLILPYMPNAVDLSVFQKPPSSAHLLGTDSAG